MSLSMIIICAIVLLLCCCLDTAHGLNICITGSSQGIGMEAAKLLLLESSSSSSSKQQQQHTVIHACRNPARAQAAVEGAGGGIPMVCNLADFDSIEQFAKQLQKEMPELDVLCLNAGIAPSTKSKTPQLTNDGYEECVGVNHLGHFKLATLMEPLLSKNGGRLVVTASSVHNPEAPGGDIGEFGGATLGDLSGLGVKLLNTSPPTPTMADGAVEYDGAKVYMDSKLANVVFCREATKRWEKKNISIRSFNPGFIPSSGLFRAPRQDNWLGATAFTLVAGLVGFAVPISVGGARLAYMATADESQVPSGSYFSPDDIKSRATTLADGFGPASISKEAQDDGLGRRLWERSLEIVSQQ